MEILINILTIIFTGMIIVSVEILLYRKQPNQETINNRQKDLDKRAARAKEKHNLDLKYDALIDIMGQREIKKGMILIFSGIGMMGILGCLACFGEPPFSNVMVICISGSMVIIYGISRIVWKERKISK